MGVTADIGMVRPPAWVGGYALLDHRQIERNRLVARPRIDLILEAQACVDVFDGAFKKVLMWQRTSSLSPSFSICRSMPPSYENPVSVPV